MNKLKSFYPSWISAFSRETEAREREEQKETAPTEEDVIWSPEDYNYTMYQSDQEVRENMKKRKVEMEQIEQARLRRRGQTQLGEVVEIEWLWLDSDRATF